MDANTQIAISSTLQAAGQLQLNDEYLTYQPRKKPFQFDEKDPAILPSNSDKEEIKFSGFILAKERAVQLGYLFQNNKKISALERFVSSCVQPATDPIFIDSEKRSFYKSGEELDSAIHCFFAPLPLNS